jgi:fatty acid desaturase
LRHLGSIVLSLILAPVVYLLAGIGLAESLENSSVAPHPDHLKVTLGILALVAAGLLYCLLVLTRISPIGPVLVSLLYFTVSVWALFAYHSIGKLLPDSVLGVHSAADLPLNGVSLVLAVPLLLTVVSPRRWRRYAQPPAPYMPDYPPPAPYPPLDTTLPLYPPRVDPDAPTPRLGIQ